MLYEMEALSFRYREKQVIRDLSLTLEEGRFHGVMGPNGCGKSTLIDLMIHHRRPDGGRLRYRGKPLGGYSGRVLAREFALVPQNFYINFPFTAGEVVMMGRYPHIPRFSAPSPADRRRVGDIMEQTETSAFEKRLVTELSGGERQRVIFARAMAQDARVLLLDEATSNLDINHTLAVLKLAAEQVRRKGKTVIAVLQDINIAAAFCDDLVFMKDGAVAAHGPVEKVLTAETLRAVFHVEARIGYDPYAASLQVAFKK